jgi:hypothetical protein
VQSAGVIRALERRRVAQSRFARAVEDAKALVLTLVLRAANALVHRQLTFERVAAVSELL